MLLDEGYPLLLSELDELEQLRFELCIKHCTAFSVNCADPSATHDELWIDAVPSFCVMLTHVLSPFLSLLKSSSCQRVNQVCPSGHVSSRYQR